MCKICVFLFLWIKIMQQEACKFVHSRHASEINLDNWQFLQLLVSFLSWNEHVLICTIMPFRFFTITSWCLYFSLFWGKGWTRQRNVTRTSRWRKTPSVLSQTLQKVLRKDGLNWEQYWSMKIPQKGKVCINLKMLKSIQRTTVTTSLPSSKL